MIAGASKGIVSRGGFGEMAAACVVVALGLGGTWIYSSEVYPSLTEYIPGFEDVTSLVGVLSLVGLAALAVRKPSLIDARTFTVGSAILYLAGMLAVWSGMSLGSPALISAGVIGRWIASRWMIVATGLALCRLGEGRRMVSALAAGCALSAALRAVVAPLSFDAVVVVDVVRAFAFCIVSLPLIIPVVDAVRAGKPASEASVTEPDAFLPFDHALFVAIFAFRAAYGMALAFGGQEIPRAAGLASALIPLAAALLCLLFLRRGKADAFYSVCALSIVGGLIIVVSGFSDGPARGLALALLSGGSDCFDCLVWFALASIGARNVSNSIAVLAWGRAASMAGIFVGAIAARIHAAPFLSEGAGRVLDSTMVPLVLFCFVALNVTVFKRLEFQKTVEGISEPSCISPLDEASVPTRSDEIDRACAAISEERSLTPREREVFSLLARGRNAPAIQELLVVSRSTAKTHVRNIYAKLGVHSQQELLDMVESWSR